MNVPKLRFKEFSDEWKEKKLGDITNFSKGKLISKDDISESGNECIRYGEIYTHYNEVIYEIKSKTKLDKKDLVLSEKNDVIIPSSGETALDIAKACCVMKSGVALGGDINILKLNENGIFISYYLNNKKKRDIAALAQGASVIHLYENHLKLLNLNFPSLQEQEKIANFLSSVDKKIELTEDKLEAFKEYKKGVMQKIFSQEIRFKDENGNDYPEWEEKKLEEVIIKNKEKNKNCEYVNIQSISNKYGFINQNEYFDGRKIASKDLSNYYIARLGCIAYNPSRIDVGSLALKKDDLVSVISPLYVSFYTNNKISKKFLFEWFFTTNFNKQMSYSFEGSVRNTLSYDKIEKFIIFLPSLPEQEKIANFLSAIDEKIEKIENSLNELKEFKKGLLQQMFV